MGLYGRELPNQNGAPLRLVVPWKYGSRAPSHRPHRVLGTSAAGRHGISSGPDEYGFYSNVNPAVDHPRWTQASERRIAGSGGNLFSRRVETLPFNGYAEDVALLYAGMDLRANF